MSAPSAAAGACPTCGSPLSGEHCPRCLFALTFSDEEMVPDSGEASPWMRLAGFELYEEIGRGGMGVVYRARQPLLDRVVAVKVLLQAKFAGPEERERFLREAQTAARLQHPGIVRIIDVGDDEGVPWFSMEHVSGKSLEEIVREHPMEARQAAGCLLRVADAVQHAHQKGVLHRDLKPSNILLDQTGQPHVTDFGIARLLSGDGGKTGITRTGQVLGSPSYAAPEQALGGDADVRTDIYGLGALLYHLLTGRPPFQGPTLDAILMQLRDDDPVSPRRLTPTVPRDLETICLQCLRKDPARRYSSASELAADLGRFLTNAPIRARPLSPAGHAWRWCQRRPWVAALVATTVLLGGTLIVGSLAVARREHLQEQRVSLLSYAREQRQEGAAGFKRKAFKALQDAWKIEPSPEIRQEAIANLSLPDVIWEKTVLGGSIKEDLNSADGTRTARYQDDALLVTETATGKEIFRLGGFATQPLFHLDDRGQRLAVARKVEQKAASMIEILDLATGKIVRELPHDHPITCMDWLGELLLSGGSENRLIHVWNTEHGQLLHRFSGHQADLEAVKFRKDGQEFVSVARDGMLRVWHAGCSAQLLTFTGLPEHSGPVEWSEDGNSLSMRRSDGSAVDIFRFYWPRSVRVLGPGIAEPRSENIPSLQLDYQGSIACAVDESGCRLWSMQTGRLVATFPKLEREWLSTALAPDASALWLSGWNTGLRKIPIRGGQTGWPDPGAAEPANSGPGPLLVGIDPKANFLALTQNQPNEADDQIIVRSTRDETTLRLSQPDPFCAAFSADGKLAVTGSFRRNGARAWSLPEGKLLHSLEHPGLVLGASFTNDGRTLWLWGQSAMTRWNTADWTQDGFQHGPAPLAFTVNAQGTLAASATRRGVTLHRSADLAEIVKLEVPYHAGEIGSPTLRFSGDGKSLGLHTADGSVVVWDLDKLQRELKTMGMDWKLE
ncbi:WD40 repeat domain-containing serine/threonine-protein kinase [Luteolibacter luteus]|uniref:non-specific serine/threonine protein kinase n=1 Tax=Luteolibacter luteus TaxID=2728835 RepID=A0A858RP06_9BACT|nr:serine/threonine-protein kinase [Luteolibacter luteus]QJE98244.1 protein kinase [Luteolibacter luteus]